MKEVLTKKGLSEKVGKETTFFAKKAKKIENEKQPKKLFAREKRSLHRDM